MKCRFLSNQESSLMYLYCLTFLKKGKHVNSDLYLPFFPHQEPLDCIDVFMRDCKCFDGVLLAKSSQDFLRQLIKTQEASYVDLRNYLFSRQCILLLKLKRRAWEIAQRLLEFLHNLVHELAMDELKVSE